MPFQTIIPSHNRLHNRLRRAAPGSYTQVATHFFSQARRAITTLAGGVNHRDIIAKVKAGPEDRHRHFVPAIQASVSVVYRSPVPHGTG